MTTQFTPVSTLVPKEIIRDTHNVDGTTERYDIAWFSYYDGTRYATQHRMRHTTDFLQVLNKTHFMVCCGDVAIRVNPDDFKDINRKVI